MNSLPERLEAKRISLGMTQKAFVALFPNGDTSVYSRVKGGKQTVPQKWMPAVKSLLDLTQQQISELPRIEKTTTRHDPRPLARDIFLRLIEKELGTRDLIFPEEIEMTLDRDKQHVVVKVKSFQFYASGQSVLYAASLHSVMMWTTDKYWDPHSRDFSCQPSETQDEELLRSLALCSKDLENSYAGWNML